MELGASAVERCQCGEEQFISQWSYNRMLVLPWRAMTLPCQKHNSRIPCSHLCSKRVSSSCSLLVGCTDTETGLIWHVQNTFTFKRHLKTEHCITVHAFLQRVVRPLSELSEWHVRYQPYNSSNNNNNNNNNMTRYRLKKYCSSLPSSASPLITGRLTWLCNSRS